MRDTDRLAALLRRALVQVVSGGRCGSGVFVAPGLVVSCAHVVGTAPVGGAVTVHWRDREYPATVRWSSAPSDVSGWPYPDLAVVQLDAPVPEHPCAWLDDRWPSIGDRLIAGAYSDEYRTGAAPHNAVLDYEGPRPYRGGEMLQLAGREIAEGMSGGPVLNVETGGVVGLVKATRLRNAPMGGLATPVRGLRYAEPDLYREVIRAHDRHHASGNAWTAVADRLQVGKPGRVDAAQERILRGILAELPPDPDHARRLFQAAGPLTRDVDDPLLDHRDVASELGEMAPPTTGLPYVLAYAADLAASQPEPFARRLRDFVLLNAGLPLGQEALARLDKAAPPTAPASVMVRLRNVGSNRNRYQMMMWRYTGTGQLIPAVSDPVAVPLREAYRRLRALLPEQIARTAGHHHARPMVEMFLPPRLLDVDVDSWRLWPEQDWSTLGRRYAVVVRDSSRLDDDRARSAWERRWARLRGRDTAECLELIECADPRSREQLEAWIEPDDRHSALVFGSSPVSTGRRAALDVGLPAGVPVMIWRRRPCPACARGSAGCSGLEFLTRLREALSGTVIDDLPFEVWKLRNEATRVGDPDHCGQNIVLLWDDPLRRPPRDRLVLPEENSDHA
jgi:hypothetical protein